MGLWAERACALGAYAAALLCPPDDPASRCAYAERFVVPSSGRHVPLREAQLRAARQGPDGAWRWGVASSRCAVHAQRCYAAAGFRPRALEGLSGGAGLASSASGAGGAGHLHADHLAVELAFLGHVLRHAEKSREEDRWRWEELARSFAWDHALPAAERAAAIARSGGDDPYAELLRSCVRCLRTWFSGRRFGPLRALCPCSPLPLAILRRTASHAMPFWR